MIERVTYARLYALPGYENERFEAVAIVQNGDVDAAFDEAYRQVEAQYERVITSRRNAGESQLQHEEDNWMTSCLTCYEGTWETYDDWIDEYYAGLL